MHDAASVPPFVSAPHGERRHATLLFIDLCGSTPLAEAIEQEYVAAIVARLREIARRVAVQHGGRAIRMQGDGVVVLFGYPEPGEEDGRRAAQAALDMHDEFDRCEFPFVPAHLQPLRLHSGIHAGTTLISAGDIEWGVLDLTGDAPNTAARLAATAPAGVVLADVEALEPFANFFDIGEVAVYRLAGRSKPVRAAHVLRRNALQRRFDATAQRGLTPFVGRRSILDTVAGMLEMSLAAGNQRCIVLHGEAGLGKTRLLEEIAALPAAARFRCLHGHCDSGLHAQVLQPFVQMTRGLPAGEPIEGPGHATLSDALMRTMAAQIASGPVMMLIDDWQWADDGSRHLLDALTRVKGTAVLVLATRSAPDDPHLRADAVSFALQPFTEEECSRTVRRWLPGADPFTASAIYRHAGGVPLFIEELCHTAAFRQALDANRENVGTSAWLRSLVSTRLARLSAHQQQVVKAAAVLGNQMPTQLLCRMGPWNKAELELDALTDASFIFPSPDGQTLHFKHGLTRDAVYDTLLLAERTQAHGRALAALESEQKWRDESPEELAYHARAAGLWKSSADMAEQVADRASAAFAYDIARAHYRSALEALDRAGIMQAADVPRWCALTHKLGMTAIFDPLAVTGSLPVFERSVLLAREAGDPALLARSLYWLSYLCYGMGLPRRAVVHGREALAIATALADKRLVAQVEATLGQALGAACVYDEALPLFDRALAAKRESARTGSSVAVGSAFTLASKASVLADRGDFGPAAVAVDEAMALVGSSLHPVAISVRNWSVMVLLWQGRWQEAQRVGDDSVQLAREAHALLPMAIGRAAGGYARWMGEGDPAGVDQIAEAVQWMEQRGGTFFTSIYYGWLVEACVSLQRHELARRHAARLFMRARAGEGIGEACGARALALAAARQGDDAQAARYLSRARASAQARGSRRDEALNLFGRAQVLQVQHELAASRDAASLARQAFLELGMQWHAQAAARLLE